MWEQRNESRVLASRPRERSAPIPLEAQYKRVAMTKRRGYAGRLAAGPGGKGIYLRSRAPSFSTTCPMALGIVFWAHLELELHRDLHQARVVRRGNKPERRGPKNAPWILELGMVEDVKSLKP